MNPENVKNHPMESASVASAAAAVGRMTSPPTPVMARRGTRRARHAVLAARGGHEDLLADEDVRLEADGARKEYLIRDTLDHRKEAVAAIVAGDEQHVRSACGCLS